MNKGMATAMTSVDSLIRTSKRPMSGKPGTMVIAKATGSSLNIMPRSANTKNLGGVKNRPLFSSLGRVRMLYPVGAVLDVRKRCEKRRWFLCLVQGRSHVV